MTTKQIKLRLLFAASVMLAGALCALAWGLFAKVDVTPAAESAAVFSDHKVVDSRDDGSTLPSREQIRAMSQVDLRRALVDPPPPPPVPLKAKLLGVIYEPDRPDLSMAMFKLANGSDQMFKVGQQFQDPVGTVEVRAIVDKKTVKIKYKGQEAELTVGSR